ncbi:MAG: S41 family peptidase, partial [Candidatus Izemoplasma sp.]
LSACDSTDDEEVPIIVVVDTTEPVITGTTNYTLVIGDTEPDFSVGVSANDETDGVLTDVISIDSSAVSFTVAGTYDIIYTVSDDAGNTASETVIITVTEYVLTDEEEALLDFAAINFDDGIDMPLWGSNGSTFIWSSSHPYILTSRGLVFPPPVGADDVTVTLQVIVKNGAYFSIETFDVVIEAQVESVVTSRTLLAFEGTSEEYVVVDDAEVNIFFMNNGTVPYIDVEEFITLIEGAIESTIVEYTFIGPDVLQVQYEVEYVDDVTLETVIDIYTATINFTENTFTVNTFGFFESYVAETESDYGDGLIYVDVEYVDPNEVTIPLGDYGFDLVIYEEGGETFYLMPFHVTNLLFAGGVYYDVYYNGDKLYGIDTFGISGGTEEDEALQDVIRTSTFNDLDAPLDSRIANYNFLALAFDYFYGLKEDRGVGTYYEKLLPYADTLINGTDANIYKKVFAYAYGLDDLHTSYVFTGIYTEVSNSENLTSIDQLGSRGQAFYTGMWAVEALIDEKFGSVANMPDFTLIDNNKTVVIYITGFDIDTPDTVYDILFALPVTVENVVFDLSYNTGGNLGAVLRIFGYMTEDQILFHSQNPADRSAVTYYIESEYNAFDYEYFIISSSVTFSAANLMVSIAKECGFATIIGQKSSGGASSIGVIMTPLGSSLLISTNNVLSTRVLDEFGEWEYISIENGIEVDYHMDNVTSDQEIIDIIAIVTAP